MLQQCTLYVFTHLTCNNDGVVYVFSVISILNVGFFCQYNSTTFQLPTNNPSPSSFMCHSDNTNKKLQSQLMINGCKMLI